MIDHRLFGEEWKSIQKKPTRKNKLDVDKLYVRYKALKKGNHSMQVYVGNTVLQRMGWKIGEKLDILRHDSLHTQFIIVPDIRGKQLSQSKQAHAGFIRMTTKKSYPFTDDISVSVQFREYHNYIMFDIGKPAIEGWNSVRECFTQGFRQD